jgi:hypothetical protein
VKFVCKRGVSALFPGTPTVSFLPIVEDVRLLTPTGRFAETGGRERLWPALWDTGAAVSIVPSQFIEGVEHTASGTTRPLQSADGNVACFRWYHVLIGLPGLPLFGGRAVAPADPDPLRPREHISLGCDIISRLTLRCESTLPWEIGVPLGADASWTWEYERSPQ